MRFSTIFTALFYPYIAHEQTAQNLDFVSSLVTICSYSYWAPLLPKLRFAQEQRAIERFQRAIERFQERCAQLYILVHLNGIVATNIIVVVGPSTPWGLPTASPCGRSTPSPPPPSSQHSSTLSFVYLFNKYFCGKTEYVDSWRFNLLLNINHYHDSV